MSAAGVFTVQVSDDARYVEGKSYNIILNSDHSYNESAEREAASEPEPEPEPEPTPYESSIGAPVVGDTPQGG
jgi:hypothetical protein